MNEMKTDGIVVGASAMIQTICGIAQTSEVFQLLQLIIGSVSGAITLIYFLAKGVIAIVKWYNKAKKDGKIDNDELDELDNIVDDIKENINDNN